MALLSARSKKLEELKTESKTIDNNKLIGYSSGKLMKIKVCDLEVATTQ